MRSAAVEKGRCVVDACEEEGARAPCRLFEFPERRLLRVGVIEICVLSCLGSGVGSGRRDALIVLLHYPRTQEVGRLREARGGKGVSPLSRQKPFTNRID